MAYGYKNLAEETVSATTATNTIQLGERMVYKNVEYVYCYNAGATSGLIGYGLIASANSSYSVLASSAAGDMPFCVVVNNDVEPAYYFWGATKGYVHVQMQDLDSANLAGECIRLEENGAFQHVQTGATGSTWAYQKAGFLLQDIATGLTGVACIKCLA